MLTNEDREALMDNCPIAITPSVGDHDDLFAAVEQIAAAHVAAALSGAASYIEFTAQEAPNTSIRFGAEWAAAVLRNRVRDLRKS